MRCDLRGGDGSDAGAAGTLAGAGAGGSDLRFQPTRAVFEDSTVRGGDGGDGPAFFGSNAGGPGIFGVDTTLAVLGCDVRGGDAGPSSPIAAVGDPSLRPAVPQPPTSTRYAAPE